MKIVVAGSRTVTERDVHQAFAYCSWVNLASEIVSGTAKGADTFGENWARDKGVPTRRMPADWDKYGKKAGPIRNRQMAEVADGLIAIWDGRSRGTKSMIEFAKELGLRVAVFRTDDGTYQQFEASGDRQYRWEAVEEMAAKLEFDGGLSRAAAEKAALEVLRNQAGRSDK